MTDAIGAVRKGPWYYGWNIVAVCVLAKIGAMALPTNSVSLFLRDWSTDLHTPISSLQLGIVTSSFGVALLAPLIGTLADKWPTRWLFGVGLAGTAVFCLGISFMTATVQLVMLYSLLLPFTILLSTAVPATAVVSRWFVRRLGLALAITTAFGLASAGVFMPPLIAAVMPILGWRTIWRLGSCVVALFVLPIVVGVLRDRPSERDGLYYLTRDDTNRPKADSRSADALRWRDILVRKNFWLITAVYLPMLGLYGGTMQNLAPIAAVEGLSTQTAGIFLSILSLTQLLTTLLGGFLSDRFGTRLPLTVLAIMTAVGGLLMAYGHGVAMLGVASALTGMGGAFWPLLAAAMAVEFGAGGVGRAFGALNLFTPIAGLAAYAIAKSYETLGTHAPALLSLVALNLIGAATCFLFVRERRVGNNGLADQPPA